MKLLKSSRAVLLFFMIAQPIRADVFDDVVNAIELANTQKLESYFSQKIDLELPDGTVHQGNDPVLKAALSNFLKEHPPKSVIIKHRGPEGRQSFVVADYLTKGGETYRLTIFMDGNKEKMHILQLKFENS